MPGIFGKQLAGDFIDFINGVFKTRLTGIATANNTVNLPIGSGRLLLDTDPVGSIGAGVSVRGYLPNVTVPSSKILALFDANTTQICTAASTITIPLNATVPYPIGTEIMFLRNTSSTVNLSLVSGVTATDRDGNTNTLTTVSNFTLIKKTATDTWAFVNPVINNVNLPGDPTCNTQNSGTNSTRIATTAFVQNATAIAGAVVNPVGVTIVDWAIPTSVRRLTLLSRGVAIPLDSIVRLGSSAGLLTTGYNNIMCFVGLTTGLNGGSTIGLQVPDCKDNTGSFCMDFYRSSPHNWNSKGQAMNDLQYIRLSSGNIALPGELTTLRFISPTAINSGSLQLLWEF